MLTLARLSGTQAEMGAQHGALAAPHAARLFDWYRRLAARMLAGDTGAATRAVVQAVADAWQARLARSRPAEFAARSRAFVAEVGRREGSVRGAERTFAAMDALQNVVALAARFRQGPFAAAARRVELAAAIPACTTAIAWGDATADGELWFARNFDFPGVGVWDAAPAFTVCVPAGGMRYGFFATRGADAPVVTVVNEAGLVIAPHTRWHRDVAFGGAMIVDLVHAIGARAESLADAEAIARAHPASSSWGIAIGSARERSAIVLELAGPHVEVVRARGDTLVCANRYRSPALQAGELAGSAAWAAHSDRREQRMRDLIEQHAGRLAPEDLARFLGDRVDPADPSGQPRLLGGILAQATNVHAVVVAPALRRALVGVDEAPSCEGAWARLAWRWDGPTGAWDGTDAGFDVAIDRGIAAPHSLAVRAVHAGFAAFEHAHDVPAALAAFERAVALAPRDPSIRLPACWLALEAGQAVRAVAHAEAGLAHEREPYRRAQLEHWMRRAGDRDRRSAPHINLGMSDAF
ncbi:MAG TPA: C45 family peptidase [Kofleriaceae bacterium]|jgi:hypothetical protein